ncbi:hypothetical protein NHX12_019590 [Muraenolepis orangiensis]|uniref:Potassium channel domain-containing protein n=1 Tax=Muraenolepis orangiensis TaxID=630683 RepID=A0A9Q0EWY2_9TELE|nr:hypothetical protein NHX12_019590 [Muraenolepis orangiensis]
MGLVQILNLARVPSLLMLGAVYGAYVLVGGVVFWKLEGNLGREDITAIEARKQQVLKTYKCLNTDGLDAVIQVIQAASSAGVSIKGNSTSDGFWKFTSSAVFAATVVTTIGYGNISPKTTTGQIFCVFFAIFGIPLNLVVLNRVGKYMLTRWARFFVHLVSYVTGLALFFVVPMIMFQGHEGWSYAQAIYYCFITLSTIGFGDYVADSNPNQEYPEWYSFLMASWIFFGLAWLALVINHTIDILERLNSHLNGWWQRRRGKGDTDPPDGENPDFKEHHDTQVEQVEQVDAVADK